MTTDLLLIRHGESTLGAAGRTAGSSDPELSQLGVAQAEALAARLESEPISAVYSSPLRRAVQTGSQIAQAKGITLAIEADLRELDQGDLEGLPLSDLAKHHGDLLARWRADPASVRMPNGESLGDVRERTGRFIEAVLARHVGETVAVVAHNFVNSVILCGLLDLELRAARRFRFDPATITLIRFRGDPPDDGWLVRANVGHHLDHLSR